jgi:hypothetical protein
VIIGYNKVFYVTHRDGPRRDDSKEEPTKGDLKDEPREDKYTRVNHRVIFENLMTRKEF